jgi:methylmalonyl-CoA/ethylmalonyl-CoA epimerase
VIDLVHHVAAVVPDADAALVFYRDTLGLQVTADEVIEEQGVRGVLLALGENEVELIQPVKPDTGVARFLESRGPTLHHFCFRTDDIRAELARLKRQGVELIDEAPRRGLAGEVAFIHPRAMRGVLIELAQPRAGAHASSAKGFDHIAAYASDLESTAKLWEETLGLPMTGEVRPPGADLTIGQIPCGQCIVELVVPLSPQSRIAKMIAEGGERAASVIAVEVKDIDAEVARFRGMGLRIDEPQPGPIPNSRRTTISADQAFGLGVQLIAYAG